MLKIGEWALSQAVTTFTSVEPSMLRVQEFEVHMQARTISQRAKPLSGVSKTPGTWTSIRPEDRFGKKIAAYLDEMALGINPDICRRLEAARNEAIVRGYKI